MRISGPERYLLSIDSDNFTVRSQRGTPMFSGIATTRKPKLYVVSVDDKPLYVGITRQSLRNRLRLGWKATGKHGYHGYAWRHHFKALVLDVWCHENAPSLRPEWDIETVEAELVFLIRSAGQWPEHQTEIHFHPSQPIHREVAAQIANHYRLGSMTAVSRRNPPSNRMRRPNRWS